MLNINTQSITNKTSSLEILAQEQEVDVIAVTEHWANKDNINLYNLKGYRLISSFTRSKHKHGGTGIYALDEHRAVPIGEIGDLSVEIDCEMAGAYLEKYNTIIIAVYRSPIGNLDIYFEKLDEALSYAVDKHNSDTRIMLTGDFNVKLVLLF